MLYDQALLVGAYLHAFLVTGTARYRRVVEETIEYVLRDLRHPDGGFFSAEDADSEGVEGKFYLWSLEELTEVCGDAAPEVIRTFGVTAGGNFRDPHTGYSGNILHLVDRTEDPSDAVTAALRPCSSTAARAAHASRTRRQGPARLERAVPPIARGGGGRARAAGLDGRRARATPASCSLRSAGRTGAGSGRGRPTVGPVTSPSPRTTPRCSRRS